MFDLISIHTPISAHWVLYGLFTLYGPRRDKTCFYPHAFLKKRRGYCYRLRPSVMLSPPKPLDEIQPNLVSELLTWRTT